MLETSFILNDPRTGEARVEAHGLLAHGRGADLLHGRTLTAPLVRCVVKVPTAASDDPATIQRRLDRVGIEYDAMQAACPAIPLPLGLFEPRVDTADGRSFAVPILVRRHFEGETLRERMERWPRGLPLDVALRIASRVAAGLRAVHDSGYVMRSLSPQHVLVDTGDEVCLVGFGNAWPRQQRIDPHHDYFDELYSAPELSGEVSGRFIVPRADVFSFGALLAYLVTGEDPTGRADAPLTRAAHERLAELPEGVALLVAHCLHPIGKKRFGSISRLERFLRTDTLPSSTHPDFAAIALFAPPGLRAAEFARVGHLSAGPLVDRRAGTGISAADARGDVAGSDHAAPRVARIGAAALAVFALLALVAFLVAAMRGG